jgi:uncharacterized protein DUF1565
MKRGTLAVVTAAALMSVGATLAATIRYVSTTGVDSGTCGASSTPCRTIQTAIDLSEDGDTVRVRNGVYNECIGLADPSGVGTVTLETDAFSLNGALNAATIDGDGICDETSDFPGPVVVMIGKSVIRGFKIQHGGDSGLWGFDSPVITNNTVTLNSTPTTAGGIYVRTQNNVVAAEDAAEIKSNTVTSNESVLDGAGMFIAVLANDGKSKVEIQDNIIRDNIAGPDPRPNGPATFGGGMTVLTDASLDTDELSVVITNNTIEGNTLHSPSVSGQGSYGGGIFVATGVYYGYGVESITVGEPSAGNIVRNNTVGGFGGGISANLQPGVGGRHEVRVAGNAVSTNTADLGGGGIHGFFLMADPSSPGTGAMLIEDNVVTGNHSLAVPADSVGGGGLFAEMYSIRTPAHRESFEIRRNEFQLNDSKSLGGGASLLAFTQDDDPATDNRFFAGDAIIEFENNLVAQNDALNPGGAGGDGRGGGVWAMGQAFGDQARAAIEQHFNTVVGNEADTGAGGFEWEAYPELDARDTEGSVHIALTNSIVANNDGFAAGGPFLPGGTITVDVSYNDAFQNGGPNANWESNLGVTTGTNGNISVDPGLDNLFVPQLCSATVDAGDPTIDVLGDPADPNDDLEPPPNGGRVNMGHLGATSDATRTLPDATGDGVVDGIDILRLAVAFGAFAIDPPPSRFDASVDFDLDGDNDGADLSYLAALYARSCP